MLFSHCELFPVTVLLDITPVLLIEHLFDFLFQCLFLDLNSRCLLILRLLDQAVAAGRGDPSRDARSRCVARALAIFLLQGLELYNASEQLEIARPSRHCLRI